MPEPRFGVLDRTTLVRHGVPGLARSIPLTLAPEQLTASKLLALAAHSNLSQLWIHPSVAVEPEYGAWNVQERDRGAWWVHAFRDGAAAVDLVQPALCPRAGDGSWLGTWDRAESATSLAAALRAFHSALGTLPRRGPGSTGSQLLLALHGSGPRAALEELAAPDLPEMAGKSEPALTWARELSGAERGAHYVHAYDKHGQYLAACSSLRLGIGPLSRAINPIEPHLRFPGYWRIDYPEYVATTNPLPPLFSTKRRPLWVTTPTLTLLRELHPVLLPNEGYFWLNSEPYLDRWYKRLRDARRELNGGLGNPIAAAALKPVYTATLGRLGSRRLAQAGAGTLYRPDWREHVTAAARCNLLRSVYKLYRAGHPLPFAIGTDCLYFATDEPDPIAFAAEQLPAIAIGDGLGQYAVKDSLPLDDDFDAHYRPGSIASLQTWLNERRRATAA